jgi:hypothetical protein
MELLAPVCPELAVLAPVSTVIANVSVLVLTSPVFWSNRKVMAACALTVASAAAQMRGIVFMMYI